MQKVYKKKSTAQSKRRKGETVVPMKLKNGKKVFKNKKYKC